MRRWRLLFDCPAYPIFPNYVVKSGQRIDKAVTNAIGRPFRKATLFSKKGKSSAVFRQPPWVCSAALLETATDPFDIFSSMKIDRIRINKSAQQPEGIEIELVKPENPIEENLLAFLLTGFLRDLKRDGRLPYELPDKFGVRHQSEGSFILSGYYDESRFYEPPQPLLIVGIQSRQGRFSLIHASIQARSRIQQPSDANQPITSATVEPPPEQAPAAADDNPTT